ncbi:uncharacterized protein LOC106158953 [Lingula anatina]|uniref:Uncharacterized protein LOC106158953 n=1 Tax=Lingula anatina TaxID=7574 RepID=A0A1S3HY93_LINAN|nr:uncharacterized protein LOC106158953 [Lingula anatina]XP_013390536.1 uncharacterized protein LOC106158953 [Lingula anatina]|eukprot:XP_013390535.1 uncharacterized protein LOC106158953 [Lingula anatina]
MTDFTLHEAQCPGGTMFNPRSKKCDLEKYVHEFCYRVRLTEPEPPVQRRIITTTTTEAPETTTPPPLFNPPIPCETNSLFPHVNCTLFYKCGDNGFPSVLTCPPSSEPVIGTLFYNERTKTCDQFNNVQECTMGAHRTVAVNLMNQFNPPFPCKNGKTYPHPDCKKYYTCVGEVPTEKTCLQQFKRMHFTTKGGGCVDATKTLLSGECNNSDERQIDFRKGDGGNNNVEDTK